MPGDNTLNIASEADEVLHLNTEIAELSDEEFDKLMSGDESIDTPPPKKAPAEEKPPAPAAKAKVKTPATKIAPPVGDKEESKESTDIDELDDQDFEEAAKTPKAKAAPAEGEKEEEAEPDDETTKQVLSSTYQHLVKTGLWREVEGDEFDPDNIDSDTYAQIATQQASDAAHEAFEELMDRTGKYRSILDHALRNGNPDEIIDLFKGEHQINALDPKVPTDQKEMIRKYYKDILEWESDDIESFINKAEADKELDKYSNIARKGYQKHIDTAVSTRNNELKARELKAQQDKQAFIDTMTSTIESLKANPQEREYLKRAIFTPAYKVSADKTITAFQAQMLNIQRDPQAYIDLIRFVMDKERYLKQVTAGKENKDTQEKFKLRLGGSATGTAKGAEIPVKRKTTSKEQEELQFFTPAKGQS
jgi:hypothetical protein